jgi:putative transposase
MIKAYRYRIYPNVKQIQHFNQSFGSVRYLYNKALVLRISHYQETGEDLSYFKLANTFLIKEKQDNIWLKEANAQSLQMSLRNLDNAFMKFFHKKSKFPRFKSKRNNHNSLQYPQAVKINFKENKIWIPKCGKVKIVIDRIFEGKIKTCTVTKNTY